MTIDPPEWDPDLSGHSSVNLDTEEESICHAIVSDYNDEEQYFRTECGRPIEGGKQAPRSRFDEAAYGMCLICWPESISKGTDSRP